jgi:4,5-dihydroxyphthalate decarboxylase
MANIPIRLTCTDYARIMPLVVGDVRPEGIDLTLEIGAEGSWPMRADLLRRAVTDPSVQGGEGSMGAHLRRIDQGDRSFVGLPIFVLRNFTARDLYVRKDGAVKTPADLVGRKIGMYDWFASGSIWYRHFLRWCGLDPAQLDWTIGNIDPGGALKKPATPPGGVHEAPDGRFLGEMLAAGDIDALYSPPRPKAYDPAEGPVVRLFPEFRAIEKRYFAETGAFPPQHLVVIRREVWEANKWIAKSLTDAFTLCNTRFATAQRSFPYVSPWLEAELEETEALMGADFHSYGLAANWKTMEMFCEEAYLAGLTSRVVPVEEYFAEFLAGG